MAFLPALGIGLASALAGVGASHALGKHASHKEKKKFKEAEHKAKHKGEKISKEYLLKHAHSQHKPTKKQLKKARESDKKSAKKGTVFSDKYGKKVAKKHGVGSKGGSGNYGLSGNVGKAVKEQMAYYDKFYKTHGKQKIKEIQKEKFFKKPTLAKPQKKLMEYLTEYAGKIPQHKETEKSPLYQDAVAQLRERLSGTPEAYERFKAPVMQEFQREVVPGIANRFSMQGGQRGSGFQNALAGAGEQLSTKLGAMRAGLQESALEKALNYAQVPAQERQNEIQQRLGAGQIGLGAKAFENLYRPATHTVFGGFSPPGINYPGGGGIGGGGAPRPPGFFGTIGGGLASGIGSGLGQGVSNAIGSGLGNLLSGGFKGGQPTVNASLPTLNQLGGGKGFLT